MGEAGWPVPAARWRDTAPTAKRPDRPPQPGSPSRPCCAALPIAKADQSACPIVAPSVEMARRARQALAPVVEVARRARQVLAPAAGAGIIGRGRVISDVVWVCWGRFWRALVGECGPYSLKTAIQAEWIGPGGQDPRSRRVTLATAGPFCPSQAVEVDKTAVVVTIQSFWKAKRTLVCPIQPAWMAISAQKRRSRLAGSQKLDC